MKFPIEKEQMVVENMGLVKRIASSMAHKYKSPLVSYDDLVQVGSIGLMRAAETFDESKGNQFSTFAYWTIKGYIMRELNKATPIRAPMHIVGLSRLILKRGQQDDSPDELAEFYRCPVDRIEKALYYLEIKAISADLRVKEDGGTILNTVGTEIDYSDSMIVQEFFATLKPNHIAILKGLMAGKTAPEIAAERGVYKQAIYQTMPVIRKRWIKFEQAKQSERGD